MTMSGDQLRASRMVQISSDASSREVVEAVNAMGEQLNEVSEKMTVLALHADEKMSAVHADIALLRAHLIGDISPRVTEVEKLEPRVAVVEKTAGAKAKTLTIWGLSVTGLVGVAVQVASVFYPKVQGPLQTLLQLLQGAQ